MPKGSKFTGPVYVGRDDGAANPPLGIAPVVQRIPLSALGIYAARRLPACDIVGFQVNKEATGVSSATINIGTSANVNAYGTIGVSAVGRSDVVSVCAASLLGLAEGSTVVAYVCGQGAEGTLVAASLYVEYLPTPRE